MSQKLREIFRLNEDCMDDNELIDALKLYIGCGLKEVNVDALRKDVFRQKTVDLQIKAINEVESAMMWRIACHSLRTKKVCHTDDRRIWMYFDLECLRASTKQKKCNFINYNHH